MSRSADGGGGLTTGLRAHLPQLTLLVLMAALIGGMVGQERTVVPLIAQEIFGLTTFTLALAFIGAFGLVKAVTNLMAGRLADSVGRRPVLLAGWLIGLPVPLLLMWAPSWGWVIAANLLLGLHQGLTWSAAVIMKLDLATPRQRGLAAGLNEAAGYGGLALTAWITGYLASRYGLRPAPFLLGASYVVVGTILTAVALRETHHGGARGVAVPFRRVFATGSLHDRTLSASAQAGFATNLNDVAAWGLFPVLFARSGLSGAMVGLLVGLYPAVCGFGQLLTGPLSDRLGRKRMIAGGMAVQAIGLAAVAGGGGVAWWLVGSALLGAGTALAYPTLLAAVADVAPPQWRASALGIYRFWRDLGLVAGTFTLGAAADLGGLEAAVWVAAGLTALSGLVLWLRMQEPSRVREGIS